MAPHILNALTGPCKIQNSVVAKPSHLSFATEAVATTPPNNYGLLKHAYRCDNNQLIVGVILFLLFAQALIDLLGSAKVFSGTSTDQARFLSTLQLCFTDQANFSCIADQQGLYEALILMMQCLDCGATDDSLDVKAFFFFADAIIQIETNCHEACKCEVKELHCRTKDKNVDMLGPSSACSTKCKANADPDSKPKTKKVKVFSALANHTPNSNAILTLLSQVNATLEATQLVEDGAAMPYPELQKHCDAVDLAMQHQLIFLDLSLQTFKMISEHLDCLNKALGPSDIEQTGAQFHELQVSSE
ncbi:hypothetical protein C0995_010112, partial [Termitomyces sp. Mi166